VRIGAKPKKTQETGFFFWRRFGRAPSFSVFRGLNDARCDWSAERPKLRRPENFGMKILLDYNLVFIFYFCSMPGADFVTVQFANGVASVVDRWNDQFGLPKVDCSQDWTLVNFERVGGRAIAEIRRALNTSDTQDRPIVAGPTRILYAWGTDETPAYHGENRGLDAIEFVSAGYVLPPLPDDGIYAEFLMPNVSVPTAETTYACKSFPLPSDRPYHAVSVQALVQPSTSAPYVHHFIAYLCKYENTAQNYPKTYQNTAGTCSSPIGVSTSGCSMVLYVWASGVGELRMPVEAGYPIGPNTNYLVLEVHYNNPTGTMGIVDNSGVRVMYTPTLRPNEAATLVMGDPLTQFPPLAAGQTNLHTEASCTSGCTSNWPHDINVIGSFLHMHQHGKRMWTSHWRAGQRLADINRVDFYSYHLQQLTRTNVVIKKGDVLNTHCMFDTTGYTSPVIFGTSTADEMCMNFLSYYPRLYFPTNVNRTANMCGFTGATSTICGDAGGFFLNGANPSQTDPVSDRTVNYGQYKPGCTASPSTSLPPPPVNVAGPAPTSSKVNAASAVAGSASMFIFSLFVLFAFC
jgi:hypothetical protein